jgi:hypothetical protein
MSHPSQNVRFPALLLTIIPYKSSFTKVSNERRWQVFISWMFPVPRSHWGSCSAIAGHRRTSPGSLFPPPPQLFIGKARVGVANSDVPRPAPQVTRTVFMCLPSVFSIISPISKGMNDSPNFSAGLRQILSPELRRDKTTRQVGVARDGVASMDHGQSSLLKG